MLDRDARALAAWDPYIGDLPVRRVHYGTLQPYIKDRLAAHFVFPPYRALEAWLPTGAQKLVVTLVPIGIVVDVKPSPVEARSRVHIGRISLRFERQR